ncbi:hypothetical protein SAMN05216557_10740 [Sphingomonas carotinifaciens]|uniref:Uncharacterized protein n=1 Tax=Sphingomonas carotinifaciens TaxID=1166323 RepID=A0A1G7PQT5_9SPHN|nr:hypothetical protein [Sphingomonas carotinifaciens]SDF88585.1 hypothetical protein SAMN05216557_10740 [Sphingomonas carotinifaciens]
MAALSPRGCDHLARAGRVGYFHIHNHPYPAVRGGHGSGAFHSSVLPCFGDTTGNRLARSSPKRFHLFEAYVHTGNGIGPI